MTQHKGTRRHQWRAILRRNRQRQHDDRILFGDELRARLFRDDAGDGATPIVVGVRLTGGRNKAFARFAIPERQRHAEGVFKVATKFHVRALAKIDTRLDYANR